jgi:monofunctional biosynthetic peptidoglycan transglycosylase
VAKAKKRGGLWRGVKILVILCLLALAGTIAFYFIYPDVSALKRHNPRKTAFMEYREHEWRQQGKKLKIQQRWVPLSRISPFLVKAVIIAEDDKFWKHEGFDFEAIEKAVETNIRKRKIKFGGSTISQQLAKNLYLTPSKNPSRKLKEALITWRMERALSKRRILEIYLNVVEWGEGIFGAEAAAAHYFGKPASALNADESSRLAVVLPNPLKYKVIGNSRYVEKRSRVIYDIMVRRGIVVPEYEDIMKEPPEMEAQQPSPPPAVPAPAPEGTGQEPAVQHKPQ